ncbi:DUF732 domain-containing protein [Mycobacterium sp. AZCC_0083]|uniref:DUF732 domain-containing protein n=1 Tax=Mycobacterium sp. AZCC_0083 TaxID=2735882 RepID=UPI00160FB603|nr:DUF732 domain-containing protein [Mycobacterium sp. AZCC_0083]MBB5167230.1 hypothetical protein [Mycobacterium sp. AZCC_0083]
MKRLLAIPVGIAACAIALAPAAQADQYDFISDLDANGIYYSDISTMIDLGKITCSQIRSGMPITVEQRDRLGAPVSVGGPLKNAGYSNKEQEYITVAAVKNMCPDQMPTLRAAAAGG